MAAHLAATNDWRKIKGERFAELKRIGQPTLVVNGNNDMMAPTINSFTLSQRIPNAQLILYPDQATRRSSNIQSCSSRMRKFSFMLDRGVGFGSILLKKCS